MARQYIIRTLLADLAEHPDRPQTAAQIAKRTRNDEAKVRQSLTKWAQLHPESPVRVDGVGIYRWVTAAEEFLPVVSAPPSNAHDEVVKSKPLIVGRDLTITVTHVDGAEGELYFVLNGKMWKAYQI